MPESDIDGNAVSRWERGVAVPSPRNIVLLCALHEASPADLGLPGVAADNNQLAEDRFFGARFGARRYEGLCESLLGRPEAVAILEESLAATHPAMVSERSGQMADLGAAAYAQQREVEQACIQLGEAFALASAGGHAMRMERVRAIRRRYLADHRGESAVRDLDEQLRAASCSEEPPDAADGEALSLTRSARGRTSLTPRIAIAALPEKSQERLG